MFIINSPNNSFQITFIDFLIIFAVEFFFFVFLSDKFNFKEGLGTIAFADLLKVGLLSLFITWVPSYYLYNSLKTVIIITVLLLLSGCIISTIVLQKELLYSKRESFNLAFQLSLLSTSMFFAIKVFTIPNYVVYYMLNSNAQNSLNNSLSITNPVNFIQFFVNSGLLLLIFALVLFFFLNIKSKPKLSN